MMSEFDALNLNSRFGALTSSNEDFVTSQKKCSLKDGLKSLRNLMAKRSDLDFNPYNSDEFLTRFLYARKMDVSKSFDLLCNYITYRMNHVDFFNNLTVSNRQIQCAIRDGLPGVLSNRDRKGRRILVFFANNWDHARYTLEVIYKSLILTLDKLLQDTQNQMNGLIFIVDWGNLTLRQTSNNINSFKQVRSMLEGLQDCYPCKFKGLHLLSQPWYIDALITFIKPFLKGKTPSKIYVHGNNLSSLHEHFPKDVLPVELGGDAPHFNPEEWSKIILSEDPSSSVLHFRY